MFGHSYLYKLPSTWCESIESSTEDQSHRFLVKWWVVQSQFMELGNSLKTIVHYLLIGEMTYLSHHDGILMVSALVLGSHDTYWEKYFLICEIVYRSDYVVEKRTSVRT